MAEIKRGEIYIAAFHPSPGSVQNGRRPVIVVSNDVCKRYSSVVTVIPLTSRLKKPLPTHFIVSPSRLNGLQAVSTVLCEQIQTVSRLQLGQKIGQMEKGLLPEIIRCVLVQLGVAAGIMCAA